MEIASTVRGWVRRPVEYVSSEWHRMAPRERRLAAGLLGAVVVFVVLIGVFFIVGTLRDVAESNEDAREALHAIDKHRAEYLEAKDRMTSQEMRIGSEPPSLTADLEAAAREVNIQIPESNEQPTVPAGKRYLEHRLDVKLRQVDLQSLANFLSKVETGRRFIMVTRLNVRRRFTEGEKLDVELTATAFERVKEATRGRRGAAGGNGGGAAGGTGAQ